MKRVNQSTENRKRFKENESNNEKKSDHTKQDIKYLPITTLNPSIKNWNIKARVHTKSFIRKFNMKDKEGRLFSLDLIDQSGLIRCVAFNDEIDRFFDKLEVQKVYKISGSFMKPINSTYNHLNHKYEIILNKDSNVDLVSEDDDDIPKLKFDFKSISCINNLNKDSFLDILAVVVDYDDLSTVFSVAKNRQFEKKEISLVDQSNCMVNLILWEEQAKSFTCNKQDIVAIKGAKVGVYDQRKIISFIHSSAILINLKILECKTLMNWYKKEGLLKNHEDLNPVSEDDN